MTATVVVIVVVLVVFITAGSIATPTLTSIPPLSLRTTTPPHVFTHPTVTLLLVPDLLHLILIHGRPMSSTIVPQSGVDTWLMGDVSLRAIVLIADQRHPYPILLPRLQGSPLAPIIPCGMGPDHLSPRVYRYGGFCR